jgi:hypothetical protein
MPANLSVIRVETSNPEDIKRHKRLVLTIPSWNQPFMMSYIESQVTQTSESQFTLGLIDWAEEGQVLLNSVIGSTAETSRRPTD